ncbi:MAG: hypothetical protein WC565_00085 [Parcubacteria group bacterium]
MAVASLASDCPHRKLTYVETIRDPEYPRDMYLVERCNCGMLVIHPPGEKFKFIPHDVRTRLLLEIEKLKLGDEALFMWNEPEGGFNNA